MEIKDPKSKLESLGKDVVHAWLADPVTVRVQAMLSEKVAQAHKDIVAMVKAVPGAGYTDDWVAANTRNAGSVLLGLEESLGVFEEAKRYAAGK